MTEDIKTKMKHYSVKAVPTTIIDGNIKIGGIPDLDMWRRSISKTQTRLHI
jgi:predicted DsbA family dithiol-disulfide isomerase